MIINHIVHLIFFLPNQIKRIKPLVLVKLYFEGGAQDINIINNIMKWLLAEIKAYKDSFWIN